MNWNRSGRTVHTRACQLELVPAEILYLTPQAKNDLTQNNVLKECKLTVPSLAQKFRFLAQTFRQETNRQKRER